MLQLFSKMYNNMFKRNIFLVVSMVLVLVIGLVLYQSNKNKNGDDNQADQQNLNSESQAENQGSIYQLKEEVLAEEPKENPNPDDVNNNSVASDSIYSADNSSGAIDDNSQGVNPDVNLPANDNNSIYSSQQ